MSSSRGRPAKSREQPANSHRCVHLLASSRKAPTGWRRLKCQDCHYPHTLDTFLVRSTVKFTDLAPHQLACALQYEDRCSDYRSESTDRDELHTFTLPRFARSTCCGS